MKQCLINQPAGLGDIIICQKIAKYYHDQGYNIVWPIKDIYYDDIVKYISVDFIKYIKLSQSHFPVDGPTYTDDFVYLPLDGSSRFTKEKNLMDSKYEVAKVTGYDDWLDYFTYKRDLEKEATLLDRLKEKINDEDYILVNNHVGSPPDYLVKNFNINTDKKIVKMDFIPGFSIFDWASIIENASEIWTVDTAIHYIMDHPSVKLKANRLEMFSRYSPANFDNVVKRVVKNKSWNYNT